MMTKKIYYVAAALLIALGASSCKGFLTEVSQDEIVPKSVTDYSELIYGEAYIRGEMLTTDYLDVMTDDVKNDYKTRGFGADTRPPAYGYYTWQQQPEKGYTGAIKEDRAWATYYHHILMANITLAALDELTGSDDDRLYLKAECHTLRANAYLMLVNLYAEPYEKAKAASTFGVPINDLTSMQDVKLPRATLAQNYALIVQDLEEAIKTFALSKKQSSLFRWNLNAALLLAARTHLYMQQYDKAQEYATQLLNRVPTLYNLEKRLADATASKIAFVHRTNPELLFTYGYNAITYFASGARGGFPVSDDLIRSYTRGDMRYNSSTGAYIKSVGSLFSGRKTVPVKGGFEDDTSVWGFALRNAEAYLIRAEAYAEMGNIEGALADLNTLREHRFTKATYKPLSAATQEEVITLVRKERRLELCFEQLRWFDLRRWDRPEITHEYIVSLEPALTQSFTLKKDDPAYTLPIPLSVVANDSGLADNNNQRPERKSNDEAPKP